ncbi:holin [Streptomyces sp. NPDC020490]|uniref:holin n=1 Tax=Streptomyces sp. NPDC020490 TaxID=3365078 RepID=UPI003799B5CA
MTMTYFKDLAERVVATYLEAFVGLLLAGSVVDLPAAKAAAVAAIPAALAVVKGALSAFVGGSPRTAAALPGADG